jgi:hypothetical protein
MLPRQRNRAQVEREIVECAKHRDDATRHLDFDAYRHLTEQLDDLLTELHALPPRRRRG